MKNKEIEEIKKNIKNRNERLKENISKGFYYGEQYNISKEINEMEIILQYIDQLENKVKELGKGQHTLMQSRRKWKDRYYKEKRKNV